MDRLFKMPRKMKRELTLQSTGDAHRDGEIRRIMIAAQQHLYDLKNRRMKANDEAADSVAEREKNPQPD